MLYKLRNDFHNTEYMVRTVGISHIYNEVNIKLSKSQIKRVKNKLCGISGCQCGNDAGLRGPQYTENGKRLIVDCYGL